MDTIEQIKSILRRVLRKDDTAYIFGSRARGTANRESDWDVLILLAKDKIRSEDYDAVSYPLTSLGWDIDQIISPVLYTQKEWAAQRSTPFYINVNNEAIRLI